MKDLKRKRNQSHKLTVKIQTKKYELGIFNNPEAAHLTKIFKYAPIFDHDSSVSMATTQLTRSIAEQFDVSPYTDEFEP